MGEDKTDRFSTRKAGIVLACLAVLLALLIGRVAWLQTFGRQETLTRAERQQHQRETLFARRGDIFDRNGVLMAGTVQTRSVYADPHFLHNFYQQDPHGLSEMDDALNHLAQTLGKDQFELSKLMSDRFDSRFVLLASEVDDGTCAAVQRLAVPGVGIAPADLRYYPLGSLASHIVGGSFRDGHGLDGLEKRYDDLLSGRDGYARMTKDAQHRPIAFAAEDYVPPEHGKHLVLTIDANIQMFAEQELSATVRKFQAKRGEVVVMDPNSGEVLALANYPTFNPQNNDSPAEVRRDSAVVVPYEPGSTFKPFIMGPALQRHITTLEEMWKVAGGHYRTPYGRMITDTHHGPDLPTWDVLVKSSNCGMSMLAERMGNPMLFNCLSAWGFGKPTGIELPGEAPGRLNPLAKWNKYSTESVAQGYEVMVTPLQLCRAFCAYANGGVLIRPTLVRGTLEEGGRSIQSLPTSGGVKPASHPLDPAAADTIRRVLCDVPIRGTAAPTKDNEGGRSDIWTIFGKTGTAHISEGKRGYSATRFNSSFLCAAPAERPRLVVAFIIHEPGTKDHYGGIVSAPGAKRLMERSLSYLQVPPSPAPPMPPMSVQAKLDKFDAKAYLPKAKLTVADVHD